VSFTQTRNTTGDETAAGIKINTPTTITYVPTCAAGLAGAELVVSDSNTQTWGATYTGSSGSFAKILCDGTNWIVVGK